MKALHVIRYTAWLVWQVLVASTEVVVDTLRPRQKQKPVLIGLPLRVSNDFEVTMFAESITMTPGTLVCGIRETAQGRLFIVHAIFGADLDGLYDSLYDMEDHMAPRLRGTARPAAFVFDEYDPAQFVDENAVVGVAAENADGLPLPEALRPSNAARVSNASRAGKETSND